MSQNPSCLALKGHTIQQKKLNINIIDDVVKMTLEFSDPNLNVSGKTIE